MDEVKEVVQEATQEASEAVQQPPQETEAERNWKQVNQLLKAQKMKIEELEAKIHAPLPQPIEDDEFDKLTPDEVITVSQAKKLAEKQAKSITQKMIQEYAQTQSLQMDEMRMREKHDDYDYVVQNFTLPLIKADPAIAYTIQNSKNPAQTAYKLGKISDSYEASTEKQETSPKAEKILKNASRPVSSAAVGSPLKAQADQFSKMSKEDVWNMSQKYARGHS